MVAHDIRMQNDLLHPVGDSGKENVNAVLEIVVEIYIKLVVRNET
jgi:hypothetical protein